MVVIVCQKNEEHSKHFYLKGKGLFFGKKKLGLNCAYFKIL